MLRAVRSFSTSSVQKNDLVQKAFLNKIKEYGQKAADLVNSDPAVKKGLQDELNRVATKYSLAAADVSKFTVKLESPKVESSVAQALEGSAIAQLIEGIKAEEKAFLAAQAARRSEEAAKAAALNAKA